MGVGPRQGRLASTSAGSVFGSCSCPAWRLSSGAMVKTCGWRSLGLARGMSVLVVSFDVFVAHVRLDDPAFFAPFAPDIDLLAGRPSTPSECYLRLMFRSSATGLALSPC